MVKQMCVQIKTTKSTWGALFTRARHIYSALMRPAIPYGLTVKHSPSGSKDVRKGLIGKALAVSKFFTFNFLRMFNSSSECLFHSLSHSLSRSPSHSISFPPLIHTLFPALLSIPCPFFILFHIALLLLILFWVLCVG